VLHLILQFIKTQELEKIIDFSNATGGLCTTKRGAIPAMPTLEEVKYLLVHGVKSL